jgi:glutaredoxin-related protein
MAPYFRSELCEQLKEFDLTFENDYESIHILYNKVTIVDTKINNLKLRLVMRVDELKYKINQTSNRWLVFERETKKMELFGTKDLQYRSVHELRFCVFKILSNHFQLDYKEDPIFFPSKIRAQRLVTEQKILKLLGLIPSEGEKGILSFPSEEGELSLL